MISLHPRHSFGGKQKHRGQSNGAKGSDSPPNNQSGNSAGDEVKVDGKRHSATDVSYSKPGGDPPTTPRSPLRGISLGELTRAITEPAPPSAGSSGPPRYVTSWLLASFEKIVTCCAVPCTNLRLSRNQMALSPAAQAQLLCLRIHRGHQGKTHCDPRGLHVRRVPTETT